jgi:hypothetical protein
VPHMSFQNGDPWFHIDRSPAVATPATAGKSRESFSAKCD